MPGWRWALLPPSSVLIQNGTILDAGGKASLRRACGGSAGSVVTHPIVALLQALPEAAMALQRHEAGKLLKIIAVGHIN